MAAWPGRLAPGVLAEWLTRSGQGLFGAGADLAEIPAGSPAGRWL